MGFCVFRGVTVIIGVTEKDGEKLIEYVGGVGRDATVAPVPR